MKTKYPILFLFSLISFFVVAQNQQSKWYFGANAALDFMQNPPTPLLNSAMNINVASASVADDNGNLLFYTDAITVYNNSHAVMANGTGLLGDGSPYQPCLIAKKPGSSNLYYIFTMRGNGYTTSFNYSIVDMSLAAGQGSVTIKNAPIYNGSCTEAVTGALHCNGKDYWLVIHERITNNFRAYLLSSAGVNTTAVITSISPVSISYNGAMKISPDGSKLAMTTQALNSQLLMHVYDFDNTTGILANHINMTAYGAFFSLEFSPDGSKIYCGGADGFTNPSLLHQWDLCAGDSTNIAASHYSVIISERLHIMQLASNGKIYIARSGADSLAVINDPNMPGAACNFVFKGQSLGGKISTAGLPVFIKQPKVTILPFTNSLTAMEGCHAMSFTANIAPTTCASSNFSVASVSWDFGDPSTGTLNVSSSINPVHVYSSSGTFTASLIFNYKCGSDTIRQIIQVPPPNIAVTWTPNCNGLVSATVTATGGLGANLYSWIPSSQTGSAVTNLTSGTYSVAVTDLAIGCKVQTVITVIADPLASFSIYPASAFSVCTGSNTILQLAGNCTNFSVYPSTNSSVAGTVITLSPPTSQNYTLVGSFNSCTTSAVINAQLFPLPSPTITAQNNKVCIGSVLKLLGQGGISYDWAGPNGFNAQSQNLERIIKSADEIGLYTLNVTDVNGCKSSTTTLVTLLPPPSGTLTEFKKEACVPFWSDFKFVKTNDTANVFSSWELNRQNFTGDFKAFFSEPGTYTVNGVLTDSTTFCTTNISYLVQARPKPIAKFEFQPELLVENSGEAVIFTTTSTGDQQNEWTWHFYSPVKSNFLKQTLGKSVSNYFSEPGSYVVSLVVKNIWACADTSIKHLKVEEDYVIWVPNAFTPNNDSRNDVFLPVVRGVRFFNLKIINRWGTLIFESSDQTQGWDGNYKSETAQDGVYTWVLTTTSNTGKQKVQSGYVSLLR